MSEIPGYILKRQLGRGGMAVVFLAEQVSLGRDVALKVLKPSPDDTANERFLREARIAARLQHPHIVPVFDFGVHEGEAYLAMQYLPGGTVAPLKGECLEPRAALYIARDVASALDYAHKHGVVHRDVKPDNVLRREDGRAMLSDFGIARLMQAESALTAEGTSVGTPHYMSPEQLRGDKLDGRSDLYSLGVLLWQLLTGDLPYTGSDGWAIGAQHVNSAIPRLPPQLSHLQALMDTLLAKRPEGRPSSGAELVQRLDALLAAGASTPAAASASNVDTPQLPMSVTPPPAAAPPAARNWRHAWWLLVGVALLAWGGYRLLRAPAAVPAPRAAAVADTIAPSIAVLPFEDLSESHDQSYFSDGMAEEVSNQLAQVQGLRVAGRSSAQSFKDKHATIAEVGKALNVNRVLEGSVRRSGDQLRVTVTLSNVADGFQIWSQRYDRKLTDVFAVQDEIAGTVVQALKLKLLANQRKHTPSVQVYDLYLRGRQALIRSGRENSQRAVDALRAAVARDPDYADAWSLLSMAEVFLAPPPSDVPGRQAAIKRGLDAAERAIALDPSLGDAYAARAFVRRMQWDWNGALTDAEQSVALGPSDGRNHLRYGLMLQTVGRLPEAKVEVDRAIALDPMLTPAWSFLAQLKTGMGDIAGAREAYRRVSAIDPDFIKDPTLAGDLFLLEGQAEQARVSYPDSPEGEIGKIMADYSLGHIAQSRQALEAFRAKHPELEASLLPSAYAWTHQPDQAFALLEMAREKRSPALPYISINRFLQPIRQDPRYAAFLRKLGMPEAP